MSDALQQVFLGSVVGFLSGVAFFVVANWIHVILYKRSYNKKDDTEVLNRTEVVTAIH
jgi:hypothetical protein